MILIANVLNLAFTFINKADIKMVIRIINGTDPITK